MAAAEGASAAEDSPATDSHRRLLLTLLAVSLLVLTIAAAAASAIAWLVWRRRQRRQQQRKRQRKWRRLNAAARTLRELQAATAEIVKPLAERLWRRDPGDSVDDDDDGEGEATPRRQRVQYQPYLRQRSRLRPKPAGDDHDDSSSGASDARGQPRSADDSVANNFAADGGTPPLTSGDEAAAATAATDVDEAERLRDEKLDEMERLQMIADVGTDAGLGRILLSLRYDAASHTLIVKVVRAQGISNLGGKRRLFAYSPSPYAVLQFLPDCSFRISNRARRNTRDPLWRDAFHFQDFPEALLEEKLLKIEVRSRERQRGAPCDPLMGEAATQLRDWQPRIVGEGCAFWLQLAPAAAADTGAFLFVTLSFKEASSVLSCSVLRAEGLRLPEGAGADDDGEGEGRLLLLLVEAANSDGECALRTDAVPACTEPQWQHRQRIPVRQPAADETLTFALRLCGAGPARPLYTVAIGDAVHRQECAQCWRSVLQRPGRRLAFALPLDVVGGN